jgi:outer membrane protein
MFASRFIVKPALVILVILGSLPGWSEQITFQHAIQLAIQHSPNVGVALADQIHAEQAYRETHNQYLPNVVVGSGLGYSYGYPLSLEGSAPSLFNVNYQSTLFNPSLREFSKSAKLEWNAATKNTDDQRKDALLDTATTYLQLDKVTAELKVLRGQQDDTNTLAEIVSHRVEQGIDSHVELTRAKLIAARVHMRVVEMEGNIDLLRTHLSQLTGLPPDSIETATESIPKLPEVDQQADLAAKAVDNSLSLKVANEHAEAQQFRAKGEWRALYPSLDLVAQYGLFSKYNNYEEFFRKFQRNNATFGIGIRFPFLNFVQRARAAQADAEAVKARKQADMAKNQVSSDTLKLQRSVRQLAAAQEVAHLEYQLAEADAQSTQIRADAGAAPPAGQPGQTVTARDVSNARIQSAEKYSQYLDTRFELDKARLQLMRATGELEGWATPPK